MGRLASRLPRYPIGSTGVPDVINLEDNEKINFGDSKDVAFYWDGSNLVLNPVANGHETFQFTFGSGITTLYGGQNTGDDLQLSANSSDSYPFIRLNGAADISLQTHTSITFGQQGTQIFLLEYASNVTTISGGNVSGDDLIIAANTSNSYPRIDLEGNNDIALRTSAGNTIFFCETSSCYLRFDRTDASTITIATAATNADLEISPNGTGNVNIHGASVSDNYDLALLGDGVLCLIETTTPTADTNYGKIYCKNDNKCYFQDGAGAEHEIAFV